jgi:hypothetical protein
MEIYDAFKEKDLRDRDSLMNAIKDLKWNVQPSSG